MFRELRKPKGDPEVLAAQAREEYFKVFNSLWVHQNVSLCSPPFVFAILEKYKILSCYKFWNFLLQLKKKLQYLTVGIGSVGLVSAYVSYSPEIAAR